MYMQISFKISTFKNRNRRERNKKNWSEDARQTWQNSKLPMRVIGPAFWCRATPSCSLCGPLTDQNGETCFKQEGSYIFLILYVAQCQLMFQCKTHSPSFYRRGSCLCPNVVGRQMWRGHTAQWISALRETTALWGREGTPPQPSPSREGFPSTESSRPDLLSLPRVALGKEGASTKEKAAEAEGEAWDSYCEVLPEAKLLQLL